MEEKTLKLQSCILQTRPEHLQNFFRGGHVWGPLKVLGQHTKNRTVQGHSGGEWVTTGNCEGRTK